MGEGRVEVSQIVIVVSAFRTERWTTLSSNVWSINEMHCKPNMIICGPSPCQPHTLQESITDPLAIAHIRNNKM